MRTGNHSPPRTAQAPAGRFPDQGDDAAQEWASPQHCLYACLPLLACFERNSKATSSDLLGGKFPEYGNRRGATMTETLRRIEANPKARYERDSCALSMEGVGPGELWQDQDACILPMCP